MGEGGEEKEEGRKREGRRTGACTNVWYTTQWVVYILTQH